MSSPPPERELDRRIRALQAERRLPSVSAAVFRRGEVVWQAAVGLADLEREVEATPDTQYRIGSITKTFTAAAVLQLRDAGALALDEPLATYIPELGDRRATLRFVLSHTSGLQREPPGSAWEPMASPARDELIARLGEVEDVLEPGDAWHYSNLGFALLGEAVERVSGRPYQQYVDERLLAPAGLARTTWQAAAPAATGHYVEPWSDRWHVERVVDLGGDAPSGQLWSTTGDLARWAGFLKRPDPDVLRPESAEQMHRFQTMMDVVTWRVGWGLGLILFRHDDRVLAGHSGGMNGFLANLVWEARGDLGAVVLVNAHSNFSIDNEGIGLAAKAVELFPAEPAEWRPGEPPPPELDGVLGNWWTEGMEFVLRYRDGRLQAVGAAAPPSAEPTLFERIDSDRYRTVAGRERGELLEILRDDAGRPVKLYWATYPLTRTPLPYT